MTDSDPKPYIRYKYSSSKAGSFSREVINFCYPDAPYLKKTSQLLGFVFLSCLLKSRSFNQSDLLAASTSPLC